MYFATDGLPVRDGLAVADALAAELEAELPTPAELDRRAYPVLRETRMAAVVCELAGDG